MTIFVNSLIVTKLVLHVVGQQLEPLLILKPQLLLQQIFLVSELTTHFRLLFFKHLCETLLDEVTVVGELFLPLCGYLLVLA